MRGRDEVYILRPLINQPLINRTQLGNAELLSKVFLADDAVLAEDAAQITSAKKNCSRTFRAADTGLLPKMQRRSSNHRLNWHAAISFALLPIRQTSSWAHATSFPFPLFRLLIYLFQTALPRFCCAAFPPPCANKGPPCGGHFVYLCSVSQYRQRYFPARRSES